MAGDSVGTMSARLVADISGFKAAMEEASKISKKMAADTKTAAKEACSPLTVANALATPPQRPLVPLQRVTGTENPGQFSQAASKAFGIGKDLIPGLGTLAGAATSIAAAIALYKDLAESAREFVRVSQQMNVSVRFAQELGLAAAKSGMEVSDMTMAMGKLQKTISDGASGSKSYADVFKKMGINVKDMMSMTPEEQFRKVAKAIAEMKSPTEQAATAMEVFGRAGMRLLPSLREIAKESKGPKAGIMSEVAVTALADSAKNSAMMWKVVKAEIGDIVGLLLHGLLGLGKSTQEIREQERLRKEQVLHEQRIAQQQERQAKAAADRKAAMESTTAMLREHESFVKDANRGIEEITSPASAIERMRQQALESLDRRAANEGMVKKSYVPERWRINRDFDLLAGRETEAKRMASETRDAERAVEGLATAEDKYAKATKDAAKWREAGYITAIREQQLIAKAQQELQSSWQSQQPQLTTTATAGSHEEYKIVASALDRSFTQADAQARMAAVQVEKLEQIRTSLSSIDQKTQEKQVATGQ